MAISSMERTRDDVKGLIQVIIKEGFKDSAVSSFKKLGVSNLSGIEDVELGLAYDTLLEDWGEAHLKKKPLGKFERFKYGERWAAVCAEKKGKGGKMESVPIRPLLDVEIEMRMFLLYETGAWLPGGLGRYEHCKRGVEMIWHAKSKKPVIFNPYAETMFRGFCQYKFLGVASHASGGKSFNLAVWSIWNFLCDPWNTKVFVTSTTLKDSQGRIWGDILELWGAAAEVFGGDTPGKPVPSDGIIRCCIGDRSTNKAGLSLIAGDPKKASENMGKFIGFKRDRLFLICDEMPELSDALLASAESNLVTGGRFQMIGIGNPSSFYDPFGVFCEPKNGWASINENDYEWDGVKAKVIRFDAKNSPNVAAKERGDTSNPYNGLLKWEIFEESKSRLGENSPGFYRMYRAFWCPTGSIEAIYSEQEIASHKAEQPAGHGWTWLEPPNIVCGFDPAYTQKGDKSIAYFAAVGTTSERKKVCCFLEYLNLERNINDPTSHEEQIIKQLAAAMEKRGVKVKDLGVDVSGSSSFGVLVSKELGDGFTRVQFGGSASDTIVSSLDKRPAKEVYDSMVAELWHVGKELIVAGQLKGIHKDMAKEMVARTYGSSGRKIWVEPKPKMKERLGFSPDIADAGFIALFMARKNYGLTSGAKAKTEPTQDGAPVETPWAAWSRKMQEVDTFFGQTFTYGSG
jgi:hypothetical protein